MAPKTPSLSEEIMSEILLKLPIKLILQCKILSKQYYSLIRSHFFIRRHLDLTRLTNNLYDKSILSPILTSARLFDQRGHIEDLDIHLSQDSERRHIIYGPMDGLYCVIQRENVFLRREITVWNPTTREHFVLPSIPLFYDKSQENWVIEMLSNNVQFQRCSAFGFGYDRRTQDYKVVVICRFVSCWSGDTMLDMSKTKSLYAFNINEGEWRNHDGLGVDPSYIESCIGVFVRGACHWIYAPTCSNSGYTILAFDMSIESSINIPFPSLDENECYDMSIVAFNDRLALIDGHGGEMVGSSSSFDVWVMAEYGVAESWSILYRVSLAPTIFGRSVGIIRGRFYVVEDKGCLTSYDLDSSECERYNVLDVGIRGLLPYEESLVRINRSNLLA
ncbi:hypothetical protein RND81_11G053100 [Saponaria officinalis]|uniref:F-box domain-containing protein n=1 Tax=Saponaria officinalis TaxID=3572 RepID=A0AAW1HJ41_SAPOF